MKYLKNNYFIISLIIIVISLFSKYFNDINTSLDLYNLNISIFISSIIYAIFIIIISEKFIDIKSYINYRTTSKMKLFFITLLFVFKKLISYLIIIILTHSLYLILINKQILIIKVMIYFFEINLGLIIFRTILSYYFNSKRSTIILIVTLVLALIINNFIIRNNIICKILLTILPFTYNESIIYLRLLFYCFCNYCYINLLLF
ncbi:MAG: hypothetical protein LBR40_00805 [Bacilli bacterium]|jgi:hypothetical protein|nr:hypothetical protein [Bacilli bacterium]